MGNPDQAPTRKNSETSLQALIESQQRDNDLEILQITTSHIFALESLPFHHKDPFDRLLIAQSLIENCTIVTVDSAFPKYATKILW
ncbi:MAG: type II toxin-antitoxin system VapC family toxin [Herpetosiphon sp.]|nr:type II toxin-antitoxin system VapC family toxin [Herpetosiphon sp.]